MRAARGRAAVPNPLPGAAGSTGLGLLAGYAADLVFADPSRGHPVAGFGRAARALEERLHRDDRAAGALFAAVCTAAVAAGGAYAERALRRSPLAHGVLVAAATWTVLGGTSLGREALTIGTALEAGDLEAARARLPHLCGRDPRGLTGEQIARAVVESVAENTADAVTGALVWGAVGGVPGLLGYRAVNTLDAMVGHRSPRYLRFGWASARLDDAAGWPGARVAAWAATAAAGSPGARRRALRVWRRDGGAHPSPNAGRAEAAFAGALGVRLGGVLAYGGRVEDRPVLGGEGRAPAVADIRRAVRLSRRVGAVTALAMSAAAAVRAAAVAAPKAPHPARPSVGWRRIGNSRNPAAADVPSPARHPGQPARAAARWRRIGNSRNPAAADAPSPAPHPGRDAWGHLPAAGLGEALGRRTVTTPHPGPRRSATALSREATP